MGAAPGSDAFVLWRGLSLRLEHRALVLDGEIRPLEIDGPRKSCVCAFARRNEADHTWLVAAVSRTTSRLVEPPRWPIGAECWRDDALHLPEDAPTQWIDTWTGASISAEDGRLPLETSMPGVFAVGDVRAGSIKRVATAVGDGATVIATLHGYLAAHPRATSTA